MSWIAELAKKGEDLLQNVDKAAGQALHAKFQNTSADSDLPKAALLSPVAATQNASEKLPKVNKVGTKIQARNDKLSTSMDGVTTNKSSLKENKTLAEHENFQPSLTKSAESRVKTPVLNESGHSTPTSTEFTKAEESDMQYLSTDNSTNAGASIAFKESDGQKISVLENENQMLKNEVTSLNHEVETVVSRYKLLQEEVAESREKLEKQYQQLLTSDQMIRDLRAGEGDLREALKVKDTQLTALKMKLADIEREVETKEKQIGDVQSEKDRILNDHTSSTDFQNQTLDNVRKRLSEMEATLASEREVFALAQKEATDRQNEVESKNVDLSKSLVMLQKRVEEEKGKTQELANHLRSAKAQAEGANSELSTYKEKAAHILQSKDKLILSLKEMSSSAGGGEESTAVREELETTRQERDMLRDELQQGRMSAQSLRAEINELEIQVQLDSEATQEQTASLETELRSEKLRREEVEQEMSRQKEELRYAHEELLRQKTGYQGRLQDRDSEIERLRSQLTAKSQNNGGQMELENRLHALTESLIQKQTMLEALSTEKNSLVLQLERMERQCREAEAAAVRSSSTTLSVNDEDEVRQRLPAFMQESPYDSNVARRVKKAANTIDKFSIRLGIFLRRYPIARVFVLVYMLLLHLWVMLVLLTYKPEVHELDYFAGPHEPIPAKHKD